jgi:hypothetical protein
VGRVLRLPPISDLRTRQVEEADPFQVDLVRGCTLDNMELSIAEPSLVLCPDTRIWE